MAEETITYKPQIDTSDLANQLQQIRSQIDQAMATYTFNTAAPTLQPQMYSFPGQNFMPTLSNAGMLASTNLQTAAGTVSSTAENAMRSAGGDASALFNNLVNSSRLGYEKFSVDAQTLALATPLAWPKFQPPTSERWVPSFTQMGPWESFFQGQTGLGHDPRMSIGMGAYMRSAQERFQAEALPFAFNTGFGIIGTSVGGAFGGPLGGLIGGYLGGVVGDASYTAFANTLGYDYANAQMAREYARNTSWRFLSGRFTRGEASEIGAEASQLQRAPGTIGYRVGAADVQRLTSEFTEMGGFDLVRSADEYRNKLHDLIENHRRLIQTLRTSEQDFLKAYKEWDSMGLLATNNTVALGTYIAGAAYGAGYTAPEFMQFGRQVREMVRGTGIQAGSAYLGGMSAIGTVTNALSNGMPTTLVEQFGGIEPMAASIARTGYNWGLSQSGLTYFLARANMGPNWNPITATPSQTMAAAVGFIQSPADYMLAMGALPNLVSQMSPEALASMQSMQFAKEMRYIMPNDKINEFTWRSYLQTHGIGAEEADLRYQLIMNAGTRNIAADAASAAIDAQPGRLDRLVDRLEIGFSNVIGLPRIRGIAGRTAERASQIAERIISQVTTPVLGREDFKERTQTVDYRLGGVRDYELRQIMEQGLRGATTGPSKDSYIRAQETLDTALRRLSENDSWARNQELAPRREKAVQAYLTKDIDKLNLTEDEKKYMRTISQDADVREAVTTLLGIQQQSKVQMFDVKKSMEFKELYGKYAQSIPGSDAQKAASGALENFVSENRLNMFATFHDKRSLEDTKAATGSAQTMASISLDKQMQEVRNYFEANTDSLTKSGAMEKYLQSVAGGSRDPAVRNSRMMEQLVKLFAFGEAKVQTITPPHKLFS